MLHLLLVLPSARGVWVHNSWLHPSTMHRVKYNLLFVLRKSLSNRWWALGLLIWPHKHDWYSIIDTEFHTRIERMFWSRHNRFNCSQVLCNACSEFCVVQNILLDEAIQRHCLFHQLTDENFDRHIAVHAHDKHPHDVVFEHDLHSQYGWLITFRWRWTGAEINICYHIQLGFPKCIHPHVYLSCGWLWYRRF